MNIDDVYTGLSLHFDTALAKGTGKSGVGEFASSSLIAGSIGPTPAGDWSILKSLLGLSDPPATSLATKRFSVAYVPYVDGRIHYHEGNEAVLSGEYSGCLMAIYTSASRQRRVAHVPKAGPIKNDCIGEFRDYFASHSTLTEPKKSSLSKTGYSLTHYFQPFVDSRDGSIQMDIIGKLMISGVISDPYGFSVFGLVTADNRCASIWAIKPKSQPAIGEMWHVVLVRARAPVMNFANFVGKTNRAALAVLPE